NCFVFRYSNFEFGCGQRPHHVIRVYLLLDLTRMPCISIPCEVGKERGSLVAAMPRQEYRMVSTEGRWATLTLNPT
ncbi:MAG: hypothetical protein AABY74_05975, partial [Planctomycetota bacterium]